MTLQPLSTTLVPPPLFTAATKVILHDRGDEFAIGVVVTQFGLHTEGDVCASWIVVSWLQVGHHALRICRRVDLTYNLLVKPELFIASQDLGDNQPDKAHEATNQTQDCIETCACPNVLVVKATLPYGKIVYLHLSFFYGKVQVTKLSRTNTIALTVYSCVQVLEHTQINHVVVVKTAISFAHENIIKSLLRDRRCVTMPSSSDKFVRADLSPILRREILCNGVKWECCPLYFISNFKIRECASFPLISDWLWEPDLEREMCTI